MTEPAKKRVRKSKTVRRIEIAEAALRIMAEHGYHGTSVERIAREVGVSNGALYQHFRNREEVLVAATELLTERAQEWITSPTGGTAFERLGKIAETHPKWAASALESFVRPLFAFVGVCEQARLEPSTPRGLENAYELILPIVLQGQQEGSIRADVDPGDLAWAILLFAWAEDMALISHVTEVIEGGASQRNFQRLLSTYAPTVAGS